MGANNQIQEKILKAISEIGSEGAAVKDIAKKVNLERHTLSKYLSFMQSGGFLPFKLGSIRLSPGLNCCRNISLLPFSNFPILVI